MSKRLDHASYLAKLICDKKEAQKQIDTSLADLRKRKREYETDRKVIVPHRKTYKAESKLGHELENLDKLFGLIIDHY